MFHIKLLLRGLIIELQLAIIPAELTDRSPINTSVAWTTINITSFHFTVCVSLFKQCSCRQNKLTASKPTL